MMLNWLTLAQAAVPPGKRADPASVVILVMVFIGVVMGLGLAILLIRRKLFLPPPAEDGGMGILSSLRAARDRGDMTQEEYEQAKRVLAARAKERLLARQVQGVSDGLAAGGDGEGATGKRSRTDVEALRRRGSARKDESSPDNLGGSDPESGAS